MEANIVANGQFNPKVPLPDIDRETPEQPTKYSDHAPKIYPQKHSIRPKS